jgi:GNAT superfamily N-acetyltransferase
MTFLTIKIIDKAQQATLQFWHLLGAHVVQESPHTYHMYLGIDFHNLNKILITEELDITSIAKLYETAQKWPCAFSWMIAEKACKSELREFLHTHGFAQTNVITSMSCDLRRIRLQAAPFCKKATSVECAFMIDLLQECFSFPQDIAKGYLALIQKHMIHLPIHPFFGYCDSKPVSSGWLFLGKETASIFYIATKKEARNTGMAAAMVQTLLYEAKQLGYSEAVLTAFPAAKSIYQRQGFEPLTQYLSFMPCV